VAFILTEEAESFFYLSLPEFSASTCRIPFRTKFRHLVLLLTFLNCVKMASPTEHPPPMNRKRLIVLCDGIGPYYYVSTGVGALISIYRDMAGFYRG
jgi:hypothetical protein